MREKEKKKQLKLSTHSLSMFVYNVGGGIFFLVCWFGWQMEICKKGIFFLFHLRVGEVADQRRQNVLSL